METFGPAMEFVEHSGFARDRERALAALDPAAIDPPLRDIVAGFATLPHCFTLQCCCGHFLRDPGQDPHNLEPVPPGFSGPVAYRIAYVALCLENSPRGRGLRLSLARLPAIAPDDIQFGSAAWFRERWPNSCVLQVEPGGQMLKDEAILTAEEARRLQTVRDDFFAELRALLAAETATAG